MKRLIWVVMLGITLLLVGCHNDTGEVDVSSSLDVTQKIDVMLPGTDEKIASIEGDQEIADFVSALQLENWVMEKVPTDATVDRQFYLYQSDTKKLGESSVDKSSLYEAAQMITYQDSPYLDFNMKNITISFKIPEEVMAYLSNYSQ